MRITYLIKDLYLEDRKSSQNSKIRKTTQVFKMSKYPEKKKKKSSPKNIEKINKMFTTISH